MAAIGRERASGWLSKLFIILAIAILIAIFFAIWKEMNRKGQVEAEIEKLKNEAHKIERENTSLSDKVAYLESVDFQEKEARDKLNLQGQGENVVIIKPNTAKVLGTDKKTEAPAETQIIVRKSNVEKWWNYFFKY